MKKRMLAVFLTAAMLLMLPGLAITPAAHGTNITIHNPYENVDWTSWGAYLAQLHTHSTVSDGYHNFRDVIEYHYYFGYDILAMTEHGVVDRGWVGRRPNFLPATRWVLGIVQGYHGFLEVGPLNGLTQERYDQISAGYGRGGRGMTRVPYGIEQNPLALPMSRLTHTVSLYADWGNAFYGGSANYGAAVRGVHRAGGISFIAHPSEVPYNADTPLSESWAVQNNSLWRMQRLFERYDSLIGIELPCAMDRVLWDTLLMNLAPTGRNVFGIQTSDMHVIDRVFRGYTWHMMPENNAANVRTSLETGAFFSGGSTMNRPEELERWAQTLGDPNFFYNTRNNQSPSRTHWQAPLCPVYAAPSEGRSYYFNVPRNPKPMVQNIAVNGNAITVQGNAHVLGIQWIADGEVVHRTRGRNSTIDLEAVIDDLGSYVRVELFGLGGVLFGQPFLLEHNGAQDATPAPRHFDHGRLLGLLRMLTLYPLGRVIDFVWRGIFWTGVFD